MTAQSAGSPDLIRVLFVCVHNAARSVCDEDQGQKCPLFPGVNEWLRSLGIEPRIP